MERKWVRVYVKLPNMKQYRQIVVLTRPGIVYVNMDAEADAMDVIMRELAT